MPIDEGFVEAGGNIRLLYRFQPGIVGKNLIVLLHGHGEHSGRYLKFFSRLQDLGFPIAGFDLRGCGRSGGIPVYVSRFEVYLEDLSKVVDFLKNRYGAGERLILFGNSLGGLIATAWAREHSKQIAKLILSSPLFGVPLGSVMKSLVEMLNRVAPKFVIKNPVHPPFLTHNPQEVEKYRADPLIRRRITIRLVHEMLRCTGRFQREEVSVPFPVYILMSEQDYVVDPQATRRFFERLQAPTKALEGFPGFFHEIFNELGQEKVFERLRYYLAQ